MDRSYSSTHSVKYNLTIANKANQQENAPADPQPRQIFVVPGNIRALQRPNKNLKKDLDKDIKRLNSHNIFSDSKNFEHSNTNLIYLVLHKTHELC